MGKDKRFWIRCNEDQYEEIKEGSEKESLSMGDYVLCKTLNLIPERKEEIREYDQKVKGKNGITRKYIQKKISTKTILSPARPGNLCKTCGKYIKYSNPRIQSDSFNEKSSQVIFYTGCDCKERSFSLAEITGVLNSSIQR